MFTKKDYQDLERIINAYLSGQTVYDLKDQVEIQTQTLHDWKLLEKVMAHREREFPDQTH